MNVSAVIAFELKRSISEPKGEWYTSLEMDSYVVKMKKKKRIIYIKFRKREKEDGNFISFTFCPRIQLQQRCCFKNPQYYIELMFIYLSIRIHTVARYIMIILLQLKLWLWRQWQWCWWWWERGAFFMNATAIPILPIPLLLLLLCC